MTDNTKKVDFLKEDEPIHNQNWVCLSFLSPEGIKNCSTRGLKIRGVFATKEEAEKRADDLSKIDPDFDVFVGEMGKWLPWNPDPNDVNDQVYQEKELNELMKGYKDNLDKSKRMQQQRKQDMLENAANQEQTVDKSKSDKIRERLKKKLEQKKMQKRMDILATKSTSEEKESVTSSQTDNTETLDEKLSKIQNLYNKINKS